MTMLACPCCSTKNYDDCCGPLLSGSQQAQSPEALMRSRYTAFAQGKSDYIFRTMRPPAATRMPTVEIQRDDVQWIKLEVMRAKTEGNQGWVEFKAYYIQDETSHVLHELSEFRREDGLWFYTDGFQPKSSNTVTKNAVGRNDPCFCGSGKKYKKCCGS